MNFTPTTLHTHKSRGRQTVLYSYVLCHTRRPLSQPLFKASIQCYSTCMVSVRLDDCNRNSLGCIADVLLGCSALDSLAHQAVSEELASLLPNSSKSPGSEIV